MRSASLALSLALVAAPARAATPAAEPPPLTLGAAVDRALSSNLTLARARRELPWAEAQRKGALAAVLPKVAAFANLGLNSEEVAFGEPPDDRVVLPKQDWDWRVTVTQPLFAGLREKRAYDQARLAVATASETERRAAEDVVLLVASSWAAAVASERLVAVEEKNVALVDARARQARDLFEAGETTRVDLLRAEADRKAAEGRLVAARQALTEALASLRVALALDGPVRVAEPSAPLPPLPSEEELAALALGRPDVKQAEQALSAATLEVKKQQGAHLPVVFAEGGYIRQKRAFPTEEYAYGALRMSLDVFRGGEIAARVAAARERETQARLALEELRRRVREEVRVAVSSVESARSQRTLSEERLAAAEADYAQTFEQYKGQLLTVLDAQSAETSLAEARRVRVAAQLGVFLAEVRAWHAAGSLVPTAVKEIPR